jgi:selT/selW/selH-like putative selenoprotein
MSRAVQTQAGRYLSDIRGEVMQPPLLHLLIAALCQYSFYLGLLLAFLLPVALPYLPPHPLLVRVNAFIQQHQAVLTIALFSANIVAGQLMTTGAFEVWMEGEKVWSKLERGTVPTTQWMVEEVRKRGMV